MNEFLAFVDLNKSLLIIPIVAAFVGWITNVLALKMTFNPLEFKGWLIKLPLRDKSGEKRILPLGWQGIIPSKAGKMTAKTVDLLSSKLITVEETFSKIDPEIVADEMSPTIKTLSRQIIDEAMEEQIPLVWNLVPKKRKKVIYQQASKEFPHVIEEIMEDVKNHINEFFDLKALAVESFTSNKKLLNDLFLRCGKEEFRFIEHSGFYFGFLFGLIQMTVWYFFPAWWILPTGGLIVGYFTNWLALRLIFYPQNPIKFLFWKIQGLFIKRQNEVAKEYSKLVTDDILTSRKIFDKIMNGNSSDKLMSIVQTHVQEGVDKTAGFNRTLIQLSSGTKKYDAIKGIAVQRFIEEIPEHIDEIFEYTEDALDIERTLRKKMTELPPTEFVGVLRPAFQEDEWKLILTGSILGGIAGTLQLILFFL